MLRNVFAATFAILTLAGISRAQTPAVPEGYIGRAPTPRGLAPKMKVKELGPTRSFELTFSKGDEAISGLTEFAETNKLTDCNFTAIGALDAAVLGWFDPEKRAYKKIEISSEAEIVSMTGSIRMQNGKPSVHAHAVVAFPDGTTKGGHVVEAHISLTLEVFLTAEISPKEAK